MQKPLVKRAPAGPAEATPRAIASDRCPRADRQHKFLAQGLTLVTGLQSATNEYTYRIGDLYIAAAIMFCVKFNCFVYDSYPSSKQIVFSCDFETILIFVLLDHYI